MDPTQFFIALGVLGIGFAFREDVERRGAWGC
jgi:hypothetical protein